MAIKYMGSSGCNSIAATTGGSPAAQSHMPLIPESGDPVMQSPTTQRRTLRVKDITVQMLDHNSELAASICDQIQARVSEVSP